MKIENKIWLGVIVGAIVLLIISIIYYVATRPEEEEKAPTSVRVVLEGDEIAWQYTGYVGDKNGPVFDTTEADIRDDSQIPKTNTFPEGSLWPIQYLVGNHPAQEELPTFDEYVKGAKIDEDIHFTIPASEGIEYIEERRLVIPVREEILLYEIVSFEKFQEIFPQDQPIPGMVLTHPMWKWDVEIEQIVPGENVTMMHLPAVGDSIDCLPWPSEVVDISSERGVIVLNHDTSQRSVMDELVDAYDYRYYNVRLGNFANEGLLGMIIEMGQENIILDFNDERAGRDLYFEIKVTGII